MTKLKNLGLTCTFVLIPDNETSSRIQCFYLAPDRLTALCNDAEWCNRVTCLARALVALSSAIPTLPKHCKIPESGQEALLQFVFVPLAVRTYLHIVFFVRKVRRVNHPCEKIWRLHFTTIPCEPNTGHKVQYFVLIIWLAPRAGKMTQIARYDWLPERARWSHLARSGLPAVSRKKNFPESHIINPLLSKFVRSRWLDIGVVLFLRVY